MTLLNFSARAAEPARAETQHEGSYPREAEYQARYDYTSVMIPTGQQSSLILFL
jgi:hypothetical protein